MRVTEEVLWSVLKRKTEEEDERSQPDQRIADEYLSGIKEICRFGIDRAKTIRSEFPMYTLHDETHICNVLRMMAELLGDARERLSRDEAAMLILAACCHDIGMSCSDREKDELLGDTDRLAEYLERNHGEYVKAYSESPDEPKLTDEMLQKYLRSIHHERAAELLGGIEWPEVLRGRVDRDDLVRVCQSHGQRVSELNDLDNTASADLRFCAVLLRLADILDFDTSRAPKAVYDHSGLERAEKGDARISKAEWQKHMASQGFDFSHVPDRRVPYDLPYHATSRSMQIEQTINSFLDWTDYELDECGKLLHRYAGNWHDFVLPVKVKRTIKTEGYVSGQYHLTMDQDRIMELLVGEELYSDPSVFVRELIQNAIDAVRTREQLDKDLPKDWKPQINIRCWMDEEGYHWFRIEDNGTGMTKEIIEDHFLKIGSSYYTSSTFQKEKIRCKADPDYMPISRFGIGILSCFIGGEDSNQVEVSTKRFGADGKRPSALRLSMHGMSGYYYLASQTEGHRPSPMKGVTEAEKRPYLQKPGTVVAVRTNLYQTGKYTGFKEIVDRYVIYTSVPIHYDGAEGSFDYATEKEFMEAVHSVRASDDLSEQGVLELPMTEEQCQRVYRDIPGLVFDEPPKIILKCAPLDRYTESPYLSGAILTAKLVGEYHQLELRFGNQLVEVGVSMRLKANDARDMLFIRISLDFPRGFRHEMEVIEAKCNNRERNFHGLYEELRRMCTGNSDQREIHEEIVHAMMHQYHDDPGWKRHMRYKWPGLSAQALNRSIKKVEEEFVRITGSSLPNKDEIETLEKYHNYCNEYEIPVCDLHDFPWYQNYFCSLIDRTGFRGITAHNGILCGDCGFFCGDNWSLPTLGTVMLLRDKYRPGVDVARLGIRELSLEMACDLALIQAGLNHEGFPVKRAEGFFGEEERGALLKDKPGMIPESEYRSLLNQRPDIKERLSFDTDWGLCDCGKIEQLVAEHKQVSLKNLTAMNRRKDEEPSQMLCQLRLAYLKQNYNLRMDLNRHSGKVYITGKAEGLPEKNIDIFPAALFLHPQSECGYLTDGSPSSRSFCNADHRFSRFILSNGALMRQRVPGILKELIRALQEEGEDDLVSTVNGLLRCLRDLPGQPIAVPDDIFLTKDDLC